MSRKDVLQAMYLMKVVDSPERIDEPTCLS